MLYLPMTWAIRRKIITDHFNNLEDSLIECQVRELFDLRRAHAQQIHDFDQRYVLTMAQEGRYWTEREHQR